MSIAEDLNQDELVDPIGQPVPAFQTVAVTAVTAAPVVHYASSCQDCCCSTAATFLVAQHVGYVVQCQVHHVPQVSVAKETAEAAGEETAAAVETV